MTDPTPAPAAAPAPVAHADPALRWWPYVAGALAVLSLTATVLAWQAHQRAARFEEELVRRQTQSHSEAAAARAMAREAQDLAREGAAKLALIDARVAEISLQRAQLEQLLQSLSRTRDDAVINDIDGALRQATRQTTLTGSAEPLVAALHQTEERLSALKVPRLENVRRAAARDLERVRAVGVADVAMLALKVDEAARLVDELPLLASRPSSALRPAARAAIPAATASTAPGQPMPWWEPLLTRWSQWRADIWDETRSLLRVTRIDHPEGMLIAPEEGFMLRENLKLRLLNARLALMTRQFDTAQADLRQAQSVLTRYFDPRARGLAHARDLLGQVQSQARQVSVPRPDDTLAALAAVSR